MRASWKVNVSLGPSGPWVIQLSVSTMPGCCRFQPPLAQHKNFPTKKAAEAVRRTLPKPFIRHGVVIDGISVCGIAVLR